MQDRDINVILQIKLNKIEFECIYKEDRVRHFVVTGVTRVRLSWAVAINTLCNKSAANL